MKATAEDVKLAKLRAAEMKEFRRRHLYNQRHLAAALKCSLRTIASIEAAESVHPSVEVLRRFKALKEKHEYAEYQRRQRLGQFDTHDNATAVA